MRVQGERTPEVETAERAAELRRLLSNRLPVGASLTASGGQSSVMVPADFSSDFEEASMHVVRITVRLGRARQSFALPFTEPDARFEAELDRALEQLT